MPAACDPRGLDHVFTFFAQPARRTMFAGVQAILPGHFLRVDLKSGGRPAEIRKRHYWDFDFPDAGSEEDPADPRRLVDEYEATQTVLHCDRDVIRQAYPRLVAAAECPVIDTSCAALCCLSREVRDQGYKVVLTGEGSDETQAGYW